MKRLLNILVFFCFASTMVAQEETRIVDSLENILPTQEGRDKVLTMIELTWEFYEISFDDCINWGEKAMKEAQNQGLADLEAKSHYVLGIQYCYHGDLDLAKQYLWQAYHRFMALDDTNNAFESLWNIAFYELNLGSIDTAFPVYERALALAQQINDTSACAYANANLGMICYKRNELEAATDYYRMSLRQFQRLNDEVMVLRVETNLATLLFEKGQPEEARRMYWKLIPQFEAIEDNYRLFLAHKNLGSIYESSIINFDSALFHLRKAIDYSGMPMPSPETVVLVNYDKASGITVMRHLLNKHLAMDYARLGRFDDLYAIIEGFEDDNEALIRENSDVYEQNRTLRYDAEDLLQRYEAQNNELEMLKSQRNQYRLAFFGLLSLVIATLVLLLARKIVRKNQVKIEKG